MMKSNLKKIMDEKGITVRGLATLSGCSFVTVIKARTDEGIERCTLGILRKLADALEVTVSELYSQDREDDRGSLAALRMLLSTLPAKDKNNVSTLGMLLAAAQKIIDNMKDKQD